MALVQTPRRAPGKLFHASLLHEIDQESSVGRRDLRRVSRSQVDSRKPDEDYVTWNVQDLEISKFLEQPQKPSPNDPRGQSTIDQPGQSQTVVSSTNGNDRAEQRKRGRDGEQLQNAKSCQEGERKKQKMSAADLDNLDEKLRSVFSMEKSVEELVEQAVRNMKLEMREEMKEHQSTMQQSISQLQAQVDELTLSSRDGEFLFVCDVLQNLPLKLSYAVQATVAADLRGKHYHSKLSYFEDLVDKDIYAITYTSLLNQLINEQGETYDSYLAQLQGGGVDEQGDERRLKLLRLLKTAEDEVAAELNVPRRHLQITVAVYLIHLKPHRNGSAHRNQLHKPIFWRKREANLEDDPAPSSTIRECLLGALPPTKITTTIEAVRGLQLLGILEKKLKQIIGEWVYQEISLDVVLAVSQVLVETFSELAKKTFKEYLGTTGHAPPGFQQLSAAAHQGKGSDGSSWTGWRIVLVPRPEYSVYMSAAGDWVDAGCNTVEHPFKAWPKFC